MIALKCDRCGTLYEPRTDKYGEAISSKETCISARMYTVNNLDLCNNCQKGLLEFLLEAGDNLNPKVGEKARNEFDNLIRLREEDLKADGKEV